MNPNDAVIWDNYVGGYKLLVPILASAQSAPQASHDPSLVSRQPPLGEENRQA